MPLLLRVGLAEFADHPVWTLSGGMQQRVGLARALAADPAVLLLDEPLGALDAITREDMQRVLLDLWASSEKTALLITHDIEEAVFLATELIVLSERPGRIVGRFDLPFSRRVAAGDDPRARPLRSGVLGDQGGAPRPDAFPRGKRPARAGGRDMIEALFASRGVAAPFPAGAERGQMARAADPADRSPVRLVFWLAAWWLVAAFEIVPPLFLPSPVAVAGRFVTTLQGGFADATLLQHAGASLWPGARGARLRAPRRGADRFRHGALPDASRRASTRSSKPTGRSRRSPTCRWW